MKKVLLIIVFIILAAIAGIILYLGYLGFIPQVAKLVGSDKPRDLGVTWTTADYESGMKKVNVDVATTESTADLSPAQTLTFTGSHAADLALSDTELTAIINSHQNNWRYYPVSDVQVKISPDGATQISGMIHISRLSGYAGATGVPFQAIQTVLNKFNILPQTIPFYVTATAGAKNGIAQVNFSQGELGRASVPQNLITENATAINQFFTQQINAFPGFSAQSVVFEKGALDFQGTLADTVSSVK